ncbi:MAG: aldo/keto reductase [Sphingobacteriales bacterium]|nr:aldo/keto reductase [Sphingobacteriales bacterium]
MEYSKLGASDLNISRIGFGCMSLKGSVYDNEVLINMAIDAGINYFDTADLYDKGANEELVGELLKKARKDVILATKVGNKLRADGSGWDWSPSKAYILTSADESLKRLKTDYIDLYQLHGGTMDDPIEEIIEAFELLKQQGKIRYYGLSSIRPCVIREYVSKSNMVSVMTQYSLLDRRPEEFTLDFLNKNNIGVLARGSVAQGLLIDKPAKLYLDQSPEEVNRAAYAISSVSGTRTKSQSAIQFVLQHQAITCAVTGFRTVEQLNDAIGVNFKNQLSEAELNILKSSVNPQLYKEHR